MIILAKLVRVRGSNREKSQLKWDVKFPSINKPNTKAVRSWESFKEWLREIELHTIYNFKSKAKSRLKVTRDLEFYQYKDKKQQIILYKQRQDMSSHNEVQKV
jgi:ASC-1-like (ASCH) protein